jgi:hypothetical protein
VRTIGLGSAALAVALVLLALVWGLVLPAHVFQALAARKELRLRRAEALDRLVAPHEHALQGLEVDLLVVGDIGFAAVIHGVNFTPGT